MATKDRKSKMNSTERKRGAAFFLLYLFVFPPLNAWAQRILVGDGETPVPEANIVYYVLLFAFSLLLFWTFWREDARVLFSRFGKNAAAFALCLLVAGAAAFLLRMLPLPVRDIIGDQYRQSFASSRIPTLLLICLLIPLTEEILFRGLLFGSLREWSRPLAYFVTIPLYALAITWRYVLDFHDPRFFLLSLLYLPSSAALCVAYDEGGSLWSPIFVHGALNALLLIL